MDRGGWWALVHGIFQARTLEWVAISYSRGSSQPRDQTGISCSEGRSFTTEPQGSPKMQYSIDINSIGARVSCVLVMILSLSSHVAKLSNLSFKCLNSTSIE